MNNRPIGIFDSGIGGLTVAMEIIKVLPNENLIYLGDTARVPYGTRDKDVIAIFALELTKFLLKQKVKCLVVACNTISAVCIEKIKKASPVPVIGVIEPTVKEAVRESKSHKIGVIGTRATINSKAYEKYIKKLNPKINVITKACPLFVPLVEEGLIIHQATELIAQKYLKVFKNIKIDSLILGCTHYPVLKKVIQKAVGNKIKLVDSAFPTALELKRILEKEKILNNNFPPKYKFLVTDNPTLVKDTVNLFFTNHFPGKLQRVSLEKYS